jgi:DNA-binding beta-propeller fold protein YncE
MSTAMRWLAFVLASCGSCRAGTITSTPDAAAPAANGLSASLPLVVVAETPLPGGSTRFDYQDIDRDQGHLVIAHMNDGTVDVVNLSDGSIAKVIPNVPRARGIVVAADVGLFFVTSSPNQLVEVDNKTLAEVRRVTTGNGPDGVGWDPKDKIVATSDQSDGAISLIGGAGAGPRAQVKLGTETGNVVYDGPRGVFWITVVGPSAPDRLVAIDPVAAKTKASIALPGCDGAHGLRIHPDGASAYVACENNDKLARVDLGGSNAVALASTGSGPDVLGVDPTIGWLYVAAESGDLTVFDLHHAGLVLVGHDHPGDHSHSVAADPATRRVFFPLVKGANGTPALRIMKPTGA